MTRLAFAVLALLATRVCAASQVDEASGPVTSTAPWPVVEARVLDADGQVEVGEPFELELVCRHDGGFVVEHASEVDAALGLDRRVVVLERRELPDVPLEGPAPRHGFADGAVLETRVVYTLACLAGEPLAGESGIVWSPQRRFEGLGLAVRRGDERRFVTAEAPSVEVASLLTPTDRGPRPLPGMLAPVAPRASLVARAAPFALGGGVVLAVAGAALLLRRRRAAHTPAPAEPTRRERLARLREDVEGGRADLREALFDLVALAKASCAARGAVIDPAATDDQWSASLPDGLLEPRERDVLARFLRQAESLRFSAASPTRWLVLDLAADVEQLEEGAQRTRASGGPA